MAMTWSAFDIALALAIRADPAAGVRRLNVPIYGARSAGESGRLMQLVWFTSRDPDQASEGSDVTRLGDEPSAFAAATSTHL
jgi:hypothetical protein